MAKEKQYVFSARTTEHGLKALNELKGRLKVSWDEMVIEAMCEKYGLDKTVMALPRKEKPVKENVGTEKIVVENPAAGQNTGEKAKNQGGKKVSGKVKNSKKKGRHLCRPFFVHCRC